MHLKMQMLKNKQKMLDVLSVGREKAVTISSQLSFFTPLGPTWERQLLFQCRKAGTKGTNSTSQFLNEKVLNVLSLF